MLSMEANIQLKFKILICFLIIAISCFSPKNVKNQVQIDHKIKNMMENYKNSPEHAISLLNVISNSKNYLPTGDKSREFTNWQDFHNSEIIFNLSKEAYNGNLKANKVLIKYFNATLLELKKGKKVVSDYGFKALGDLRGPEWVKLLWELSTNLSADYDIEVGTPYIEIIAQQTLLNAIKKIDGHEDVDGYILDIRNAYHKSLDSVETKRSGSRIQVWKLIFVPALKFNKNVKYVTYKEPLSNREYYTIYNVKED